MSGKPAKSLASQAQELWGPTNIILKNIARKKHATKEDIRNLKKAIGPAIDGQKARLAGRGDAELDLVKTHAAAALRADMRELGYKVDGFMKGIKDTLVNKEDLDYVRRYFRDNVLIDINRIHESVRKEVVPTGLNESLAFASTKAVSGIRGRMSKAVDAAGGKLTTPAPRSASSSSSRSSRSSEAASSID